jgi:serine/threonine protein phosphatase PrpC
VATRLAPWAAEHGGATTLLAVELMRIDGVTVADLAAIGDSEAWMLIGGEWVCLYQQRNGDGTYAIPGSTSPTHQRLELPPDSVLVLATDGFAEALGDGGSRLATELAARWASAPPVPEFANLVNFQDQFQLDDRGVIAVWTGRG